MKGGEIGNTISPQIGGRSGSAKPSAFKQIIRPPSYIRSCTGTGTAVGPPARRQQAYKN
jgi:hypothetical protein